MKSNILDKGKCGIYVIQNTTNNKVYVGKSIDIHRRIKSHITLLNNKSLDENRYLISSWHKYGRNSFIYYVVEYIDFDISLLRERELYWILHFNSTDKNKGYNLRLDSSSNMIVHEETRKLMSHKGKERYLNNPELKVKIGSRSSEFWKNNPETKKTMSTRVSDSLKKYTIVKLTKELGIVCEFNSQKEIRDNYPELYLPAILQVCNGNKASYKGFYWRYRCVKTKTILHLPSRKPALTPVLMIDKSSNLVIKRFNSLVEAASFLKIRPTNIGTMCVKKLYWKSKSYFFRYEKDYEDIVQPQLKDCGF